MRVVLHGVALMHHNLNQKIQYLSKCLQELSLHSLPPLSFAQKRPRLSFIQAPRRSEVVHNGGGNEGGAGAEALVVAWTPSAGDVILPPSSTFIPPDGLGVLNAAGADPQVQQLLQDEAQSPVPQMFLNLNNTCFKNSSFQVSLSAV